MCVWRCHTGTALKIFTENSRDVKVYERHQYTLTKINTFTFKLQIRTDGYITMKYVVTLKHTTHKIYMGVFTINALIQFKFH